MDADRKHSIYTVVGSRFTAANSSAEVFRKMCKDLYTMAKSGLFSEDLKFLADMIVLPTKEHNAADAGPEFPTFTDDDDEAVEIVGITCKCPSCIVPIPIPGAEVGEQKAESCKRRRINSKQPGGPPSSCSAPSASADAAEPQQAVAAENVRSPVNDKLDLPISLPIMLVLRRKGSLGGYILQRTGSYSYVCGMAKHQNENYLELLEKASKMIREKSITTPRQAREWLKANK